MKNKPIASPNLLMTEYREGLLKGRKQGRRLKMHIFIIWTIGTAIAGILFGQTIGVTATVSKGNGLLKADVERLEAQNTKLKVENYELRDCLRDRDIAINKIKN